MTKEQVLTLNAYRDIFHQAAVDAGWHSYEETPLQFHTRFVANMHGEMSEFWEAVRNNKLDLPCDKKDKMIASGLPVLTASEEEIADLFIRLFDACGRMKLDIDRAITVKYDFNKTRGFRHGGKKA